MSKRYPGNFITGNPVALTQSSNTGVWDLKDQFQATNSNTWQEADGIYEIGRSLRFRNSASAYLSRTPTVVSNQKTFTYSSWIKRSGGVNSGNGGYIFVAGTGTYARFQIDFYYDNIEISQQDGAWTVNCASIPFYKDLSAWYHIVVAIDTTQAVPLNRVKLYVNGVLQALNPSGLALPSQNYNFYTNSITRHDLGQSAGAGGGFFDGYMAEVNFIDGQQLDSSYFGYTDSITGIWQPKRYTGAYGKNGFYLPFKDTQTLNNLAKNYGTPSNYLPATNDLSNATYWAFSGLSLAKNVTDPFGVANNAYTLTTTAAGYTALYRTYFGGSTPAQNMQWCFSIYVKTGNYNYISMGMGTDDLATAAMGLIADSTTGAIYQGSQGMTTSGNATNASWGSKHVGNGWYRFWISGRFGATSQCRTDFAFPVGSGKTCYVYGPQLNIGSEPDDTYINTSTMPYNTDWTPNNFSLTAGVTYDSMVDSPTNVFTTATDVGGVVSGNYCTWNPLQVTFDPADGRASYSNANLVATKVVGQSTSNVNGTIAFSSGKWYWEVTVNIPSSVVVLGVAAPGSYNALTAWRNDLSANLTGTASSVYGASFVSGNTNTQTISNNDTIGIAVDADTRIASFYKNGTFVFSVNMNTSNHNSYTPLIQMNGDNQTATLNAGQRPFAYTPPAGYKSLNTTNVQALGTAAVGKAAIQPNKWFDATLYGGIGTTQKITNSGEFQPDLVWVKSRSAAFDNIVQDSVRGAGIASFSNLTNVESSGIGFSSFNSNGFTLSGTTSDLNYGGAGFLGWQWKQSPTAGFNIVPYTGTGVARSISHNLGVAPKMMIVKRRDTIANWAVYHESMPSAFGVAGTQVMNLNATTANTQDFNVWESNNPTSSGFSVGASALTNASGGTYIAYLWAEVPGFSKFGSYVGNGSTDGPFIHLGFKPKWIMIKNVTSVEQWSIIDVSRYPYNDNVAHILFTNSASVEDNNASYHQMDFLSNGIKIRAPSQQLINTQNNTYIYAAFAESPFGLNNRAR